ncbi:hypothetical protein [Acetobacter cibinongensis]|uniref:hypothetical protein n=1 Tax=Acetobacter cibinongensis TaxID=146475 RepID=UPI000A3B94C5|nr:hypothetical protein [Acetobacter cibinongensis]
MHVSSFVAVKPVSGTVYARTIRTGPEAAKGEGRSRRGKSAADRNPEDARNHKDTTFCHVSGGSQETAECSFERVKRRGGFLRPNNLCGKKEPGKSWVFKTLENKKKSLKRKTYSPGRQNLLGQPGEDNDFFNLSPSTDGCVISFQTKHAFLGAG